MTGEMCDSQQGAWLRTQPTEPQVPTSPTKRGTSKAGSEHRAETAARSRLPQGCTSARVRFILRSGAQQVQVHGFYDHIHHSQVDVNRRAASAPEQKAQRVARFASPPSLACVTSRFAGHNMKKSRRLGFSVTSITCHGVNIYVSSWCEYEDFECVKKTRAHVSFYRCTRGLGEEGLTNRTPSARCRLPNTPHTRTTCTLAHSGDTTTMVTPGYGNAYTWFATSCTAQQQGLTIRFTRRVAYEMFWTSALSTRALELTCTCTCTCTCESVGSTPDHPFFFPISG